MSVIDGTAGFGQDGLILASTGANVIMIEHNPIIAMLLLYEHQMMNTNPYDSYSAKVGKTMQMLHELANPPSHDDEKLFLNIANAQLKNNGKIIVKRPLSAPHLANKTPMQSVANDAIRFDRY